MITKNKTKHITIFKLVIFIIVNMIGHYLTGQNVIVDDSTAKNNSISVKDSILYYDYIKYINETTLNFPSDTLFSKIWDKYQEKNNKVKLFLSTDRFIVKPSDSVINLWLITKNISDNKIKILNYPYISLNNSCGVTLLIFHENNRIINLNYVNKKVPQIKYTKIGANEYNVNFISINFNELFFLKNKNVNFNRDKNQDYGTYRIQAVFFDCNAHLKNALQGPLFSNVLKIKFIP